LGIRLIAALITIGLSAPAFAAEISLPVNDIVAIGNALVSLDGYDRSVKDGTQDRVIKEPYKFSPGVRLTIARDLTAVKAVVADVQATARGLDKAAIDKLGLEKQPIVLAPILTKDLSLDQNPIPPSVLSALNPVIVVE